MKQEKIKWKGIGRWLAISAGALLLVGSIPAIFVESLGAAAGWNIFLGLLLIGAIASGNRKAPLLTVILCALMLLRLIVGLAMHPNLANAFMDIVLIAMLAGAWRDLSRQAQMPQADKPLH